jgi:hypothetical protein
MNSGSATTITVNTALFAAGDTVFILNQGAGVCTITAGTATVTTAASLAMAQNETGQLYFLSTSAAIFTEYMQAAAGGGGKVLQVVNATTSTLASSTSATFADTNLTATITPTLSTSKVLVLVSQNGIYKFSGDAALALKLLRGATELIRMEDIAAYTGGSASSGVGGVSTSYLDSPATTSATTYKTTFANRSAAGTCSVQATYGGGLQATSTITLMEIGA